MNILPNFSYFCVVSRCKRPPFNSENRSLFWLLLVVIFFLFSVVNNFFLIVSIPCYTLWIKSITWYRFFPPWFHCVESTIFNCLFILHSGNFDSLTFVIKKRDSVQVQVLSSNTWTIWSKWCQVFLFLKQLLSYWCHFFYSWVISQVILMASDTFHILADYMPLRLG